MRVTEAGVGFPIGDSVDVGAPTLRCDICKATWFGDPFMACPWCEERPELDRQIQESLDTCRLRDLLNDVREGSQVAIVNASRLLAVAIPRGTLPDSALHSFRKAVSEAP